MRPTRKAYPLASGPLPTEAVLLRYVEHDLNGGCWLWRGPAAVGYGYIWLAAPRRCGLAHRVSWAMRNGPIPAGSQVLHSCDVALCVNPDHLHLGTATDNMREMVARRRARTGGTKRRLDPEKAETIRRLLATHPIKVIARECGVDPAVVRRQRDKLTALAAGEAA